MTSEQNTSISRRTLLSRAVIGAFSLTALPQLANALQTPLNTSPWGVFRIGLQSYSLRHFSRDEMLVKTQELGLNYLEGFPTHFPITEDAAVISEYQEKLKAHDIRMVAYGVVDLSNDEADARRKFAFAKAMGIRTLTASPKPDSFGLLDKLVDEYKVNVAIHNHGPGDIYDQFEKVKAAIDGHNPRIGACVDTGHYLRSNESPLSAAFEFIKMDRLFDIHLKNVKEDENGKKQFTEIGVTGGLLDTVAILRMLKEHKYRGLIALEYEDHEDDPMPYIKQCLDATKNYVKTVMTTGLQG